VAPALAKPLKIFSFSRYRRGSPARRDGTESDLNARKIRVFFPMWHGLCYCTIALETGEISNPATMER